MTTKELPASVGASLLDINRTSIYYKGSPVSDDELACKEIKRLRLITVWAKLLIYMRRIRWDIIIKLIYMNNVQRKLIKEIKIEELQNDIDIKTSILKIFKDAGYQNAVDREKLLVINHDREKLKPLVNISGENIIICYADIVIPKSAVEIERKNGIIYYFQTTEKCHEFNPHIHAKYQGEKVSVYLKTLKIDGKMKNKKKLKEIVGYVMKHREELLEKWKKYCVR